MSNTQILRFGLRDAVPPDAPAAWGARLIYPDDLVWDRTDAVGHEDVRRALLDYLRKEVRDLPFKKARERHNRGELHQSGVENVILYEDERVKMVGNPRGGSGYLYVAAWFKFEPSKGYSGRPEDIAPQASARVPAAICPTFPVCPHGGGYVPKSGDHVIARYRVDNTGEGREVRGHVVAVRNVSYGVCGIVPTVTLESGQSYRADATRFELVEAAPGHHVK